MANHLLYKAITDEKPDCFGLYSVQSRSQLYTVFVFDQQMTANGSKQCLGHFSCIYK